jgi:hypothetical protein
MIERIDTNGRGKTVSERMLADAHGSDADKRTWPLRRNRAYGLWQGHAADLGHQGIWCQPVGIRAQDPAT